MARAVSQEDLPEYAGSLLSEVVERTGYRLVVVEQSGIGYDTQVSSDAGLFPYRDLDEAAQLTDSGAATAPTTRTPAAAGSGQGH